MLILTAPCRIAHRDTRNRVLVHPILSPDEKVTLFQKIMKRVGLKQETEGVERRGQASGEPKLSSNLVKLGPRPLYTS